LLPAIEAMEDLEDEAEGGCKRWREGGEFKRLTQGECGWVSVSLAYQRTT